MPTKSKTYPRTIFGVEILKMAISHIEKLAEGKPGTTDLIRVYRGAEKWRYSTLQELFVEHRKGCDFSGFWMKNGSMNFTFDARNTTHQCYSEVEFGAEDRLIVEEFCDLFEKHAEASYIPEPLAAKPLPPPIPAPPTIFIGHGRNPAWRDLKDHLQDKHDFKVEAYETGTRAGHAIRDILEEMLGKSSIAFLVLTAEDELADKSINPRLNVVHETGLFQGRLGFARAIVLLEEEANEFSNLEGVQQLRFHKNSIKETFGDVVATIKREFPSLNR